jgi:N-acetylglucosaminyldiphosphoundecaprenol N-acetyl-beta-D-mannosaminyltransferase
VSRVDVLGVPFDRLDLGSAVRTIVARMEAGQRSVVITANPEFVMLARRDAGLRAIAVSADLVVPDGTGVLVASRILGDPLPGRAPGRRLVDDLAERLAGIGASFFLLGAAPGVAERAAQRLRQRHPGISIAGTYAGRSGPEDDADTAGRVQAVAPHVLLVAYGMPAQERWIARNIARLPSVRVAIGVGGVLDQLAGVARLPPEAVHAVGFEWLWRLLADPRRWRRQRVLPLFALLVVLQRVRPPAARTEAMRRESKP